MFGRKKNLETICLMGHTEVHGYVQERRGGLLRVWEVRVSEDASVSVADQHTTYYPGAIYSRRSTSESDIRECDAEKLAARISVHFSREPRVGGDNMTYHLSCMSKTEQHKIWDDPGLAYDLWSMKSQPDDDIPF